MNISSPVKKNHKVDHLQQDTNIESRNNSQVR